MSNKQLEKNHYPIYWIIDKGKIVIHDRHGWQIAPTHKIYQIEIDFIESRIKELEFEGEIELLG